MVSLFNALNISSNALTVNESAISVVSHNVANMNTEALMFGLQLLWQGMLGIFVVMAAISLIVYLIIKFAKK
jgi:hypothetical protein